MKNMGKGDDELGKRVQNKTEHNHKFLLSRRIIALTLVLMMVLHPMTLARIAYAVEESTGIITTDSNPPAEESLNQDTPPEGQVDADNQGTTSDDTDGVDDEIEGETTEADPSKSESTEAEPTVSEPTEAEPTESEPTEAQPTESEPNEAQPTESEPTEAQPTESKPTEEQPTESEPTEAEPTESESTEAQPTESEPTEAQPTESEPTEAQPTESEPTEAQPTESEPTESNPGGPVLGLAKVPANGGLLADENTYGNVTITLPEGESTYTVTVILERATADGVVNGTSGFAEWCELILNEQVPKNICFEDSSKFSWDVGVAWNQFGYQIMDVQAGSVIKLNNISASGTLYDQWDAQYIFATTNVTVKLISSDPTEIVELEAETLPLTADTVFAQKNAEEDTGEVLQNLTEDTFLDVGGKYDLLYMLNNYNVVSKKDMQSVHIFGPVIGQNGAYYTGDSIDALPGTAGTVLSLADYTKGNVSYVGKLYEKIGMGIADFQMQYGEDDLTVYAYTGYPNFYTRATDIDDATQVGVSVGKLNGSADNFQIITLADGSQFTSPHFAGATWAIQENSGNTFQNDNFIDFDALWDELNADSQRLMNTGRIDGKTDVIVIETTDMEDGTYEGYTIKNGGQTLEIEAGKSYLIENAPHLSEVNVITPHGYDFFDNPWPIPTTVSFSCDTINPAIYDGKTVSRLPSTLINGSELEAKHGANGEYGEVGNKLIWNLPNVETDADDNNRLVATGFNMAGHIVAPNAKYWNVAANQNADGTYTTTEWKGGNINGAIIVADFLSGNTECHFWPYKGAEEQTTAVDLVVDKTFTNGNLSLKSFEFILTKTSDLFLVSPDEDAFPITVATDEAGKAYFPSLIFNTRGTHTFHLKEVVPDTVDDQITYDLSEYVITVVVDSQWMDDIADGVYEKFSSDITITQIKDAEGNDVSQVVDALEFTNTAPDPEGTLYSHSFTKVNMLGNKLAGATFALTDDLTKWEEPLATITSDENGVVSFDSLLASTIYYFKETVTPDGYLLPSGYWKLTVDEQGAITVEAMEGAPEITNGELINVNEDDTLVGTTLSKQNLFGDLLEGAVFYVERVQSLDDHTTFEGDGSYSATVTSNADG